MTTPDCGDDEWFDHDSGMASITVEVTQPEVLGTLYVVTNEGEQPYTLLDRPQVKFGYC